MGRSNYVNAEEKVVNELKNINKPFIIIMNSTHPNDPETRMLSDELKEKYNVPVIPVSVVDMTEKDIVGILKEALYEFPVEDIEVNIPDWVSVLSKENKIKKTFMNAIQESVVSVDKLRDIENINLNFEEKDIISNAYISNLNTNTGEVTINLEAPDTLFDEVLKDTIGLSVKGKKDLLRIFTEYKEGKTEYDGIKSALKQVYSTGYGIVFPKLEDMKLETPEIIKQAGRYGVKLKALGSSIHMIKVDVESTFEPIIGTEMQSKELIDNLMKDKNNEGIWKSEIFGRSLEIIVQEGIQAKLNMVPESVRYKLGSTITKIVNKGSNNLIAIVL